MKPTRNWAMAALYGMFAVICLTGCSTISDRSLIENTLHTQRRAWNAGDIEAFMSHYWKSENLTFSAGGQTTRGWQATLDRYINRYPTRTEMGTLRFDEIEVTMLGDEAAMVLGRWRLDRDAGPVGGNFTLLFRRIANNWLIVHDHTSTDTAE